MSELLPCRFCGGEAFTYYEETWWVSHNCSGKYIVTKEYKTEAEAIAAWNSQAEQGGERMSAVQGARCPWMDDGRCHTNCMLFVTATDAYTTSGTIIKGDGHCSIAVAASHIASEKHYGGNYLVRTVSYNDEAVSE